MAQIYSPPLGRLLRSLLLQCVILLGIVSTAVGQTYPNPRFYEGPWRTSAPANVTTSGLSSDGADISPSEGGGSAQLRTTAAYVDVKLQEATGEGKTGYKVSFSIRSTAPTNMRLSYQVVSPGQEGGSAVQTVDVTDLYAATTTFSRHTAYLPSNATSIRFQRAEQSTAYLFLDAIEVSQQPEFKSFSPNFGVPTTEVTITGVHLDETSKVLFGTIEAILDPSNISSKEVKVAVPTGAVSGLIKVITPYGEAVSATEFVVPKPEFAKASFSSEPEFSPATAGPGDVVTLNGRYFTGTTAVKFNGVDAPGFKVESDSKITVTIPLAATSGPITVTTPAGTATSAPFAVLAPQIIALAEGEENAGLEFAPAEGGPVGTVVTIYGKYFLAATEVLFNGVPATFTKESDSVIKATVPMGASTGFITVKSPAGENNTSTEFELPAPAFAEYTENGSQFLPTSAGPNMQIRLFGTNLASASRVVFLGDGENVDDDRNGTILQPLTSTSNTELVVTVPVDAKSGKIQIFAPGLSGTEVSTTSTQVFTFVAAPTITTVANTTGDLTVEDRRTYALVGEQVTITGTNFETATSVTIGNATIARANADENVEGFSVNEGGTEIVFTIPATVTTSTGIVKVNTLGGEATWDGTFDVILKPVITALAPSEGPIGGKITLTGENLKYVSGAIFLGENGIEDETDVRISFTTPNASDTELKFVVPSGATTGKLLVVNLASKTETSVFTVVRKPVILTITPNKGAEGTEVTITGYNFLKEVSEGGNTAVTFAGATDAIPAANLTITSDSTMTVNVPVGAVTGVITVSNTFGSDVSEEFFIYQLPTIDSFTPERGIVGNQVVIEGTNFYAEGMVVTFLGEEGDDTDNVNATAISVNVAEQTVTATVPTGAVTGKLMVTNAAGNSAPSADRYEVVTTAEILSFKPTQGKAAAPATPVEITGWLMQNVTHVGFNGTKIAVTPSTDGKTINTTVPTGATTGPLSLYEGETSVFTTTDIFKVIPEPSIYSFDPTSGVAETVVTITGTNFEGISEILFNEAKVEDLTGIVLTPVVIDGVNYQEFTVAVPNDATTGPIKITATGGTATSSAPFVVPVPANITFEPQTSYANQLVTIRGQYFKNVTEVKVNTETATIVGEVTSEVKDGEPTGFQLLIIKAPFNAGVGPIAITTSAGTGTSTGNYTVIEPVIDNISVTEGYAGRTEVTITGTNFANYWNEDANSVQKAAPIVRIGSLVVNYTYNEETSNQTITFTLPDNARSSNITVESLSGISAGRYFNVKAPVVKTINPNPAYAGQVITVRGDEFLDVQSVLRYNNEDITIIPGTLNEAQVDGSLQFIAPKAKLSPANGQSNLTVTSLSGSGSIPFTVYKPQVSSIVESNTGTNRVYAGIGKTVTITGTRFDDYWDGEKVASEAPKVTFAGGVTGRIVSATYNEGAGTDVLVVEVPAGAATGAVQIESQSGTGQSSSITIIGAPNIASFTPAAQVVGGSFTITGTDLDEATSVTFLGRDGVAGDEFTVYAADFTASTSTAITLNVPAEAVAGKIQVTTPHASTNTATSSDIFRIVKAPVITSINETEQQALQTITLRGANLWDVYTNNPSGAIKVWFRGHGNGTAIPAPANEQIEIAATVKSYDLVNGDWVTVEVPRDAITGVIKVTNAAGSFTTATEFKVTSPVIVRFEKVDGSEITDANKARINETVLIRGYQLADIGTIKIGGQNVVSFKEIESDPTTAEMIIPKGARRNTVQLTSLGYTETSGKMLEIAVPTITITNDPVTLSFNVVAGETSPSQTYTVSASNLAVGEEQIEVSVNGANDFEIALSEEGPWEKSVIVVPQAGDNNGTISATLIYVRSNPAKDATTNQSGTITNSSFDAVTRTVTLKSTIVPLPVELIAFNARKEGNGVLLTWATASELDNDYFEVQMTEDMKSEFKTVGKVKSKVGTSSIRQDYQFNHRGNFTGTRYYRLKQVDFDGTSDYSRVVAVSSSGADLTAGPKVYPNPITSDSKLAYNAETEGKLQVRVVNMNGTTVHNQSYDIEAGENTIMLNLNNNLPTGIYILMTEFNGKVQQVKLLKQ